MTTLNSFAGTQRADDTYLSTSVVSVWPEREVLTACSSATGDLRSTAASNITTANRLLSRWKNDPASAVDEGETPACRRSLVCALNFLNYFNGLVHKSNDAALLASQGVRCFVDGDGEVVLTFGPGRGSFVVDVHGEKGEVSITDYSGGTAKYFPARKVAC